MLKTCISKGRLSVYKFWPRRPLKWFTDRTETVADTFSPYFRLHRMHEMQTIVTDVRGVCPSV